MWIEWAETALGDMEEIFHYLQAINEELANTTINSLVAATVLLQSFPLSGRQGRVPGTRELIVKDQPYLIHYVVEGETLFIVRVRHTSREPLQ